MEPQKSQVGQRLMFTYFRTWLTMCTTDVILRYCLVYLSREASVAMGVDAMIPLQSNGRYYHSGWL